MSHIQRENRFPFFRQLIEEGKIIFPLDMGHICGENYFPFGYAALLVDMGDGRGERFVFADVLCVLGCRFVLANDVLGSVPLSKRRQREVLVPLVAIH
jgi:hypothetical protein